MDSRNPIEKQDIPFRTDAEISELVAQFEQCRWPHERWTHRAHLAVAVAYLRRYPFEEALRLVRRNIQNYNRTCGDPRGYHETITVFFMRLVEWFLEDRAACQDRAELVAELCRRYGMNTLLEYYSPAILWSSAAKESWVEPDRKPLEWSSFGSRGRAPQSQEFTIAAEDACSGDASRLIAELSAELARRYDHVDDGTGHFHPADVAGPRAVFLIGRLDGRAVACGAIRPFEGETDVGEVKRMYVEPAARGRGLSKRLLAALETEARRIGYTRLRLETGDAQPEALRLYESVGYQRIETFGAYVGCDRSICFEKRLA